MKNELSTLTSQLQSQGLGDAVIRTAVEVRSAIEIAQSFKRDIIEVEDTIKRMCVSATYAEKAIYNRPVSKKDVIQGPSIRLAEDLALAMGNIDYGIRTLETKEKSTTFEVFAFDKQKNIRVSRIYTSSHYRYSYGKLTLESRPQQVYELVAAESAKRLRACILQIIPNYLISIAEDACLNALKKDKKFDVAPLLSIF